MNNNYETVDQMLKKKYSNKRIKKRKRVAILTLSGLLALVLGVTGTIFGIITKFNKKNKEVPSKPTNTITKVIGDLGSELEMPKKPTYGNVTGNVDVNNIVEKDGKLYNNEESAKKSDKVGNVVTDTKKDTLIVDSNGTVKEKDKGYEIVDKEGTIIQSGTVKDNEIIDGYVKDEKLEGTYEKEDDTTNLVHSDADYYNEEGFCIIKKGDLLSKEALEFAQANLSTKAPVETPEPTPTPAPSKEGVQNEDGTYTIFGLTFETKADYEQWVLQGYEGYAILDGVMQPTDQITNEYQKTK